MSLLRRAGWLALLLLLLLVLALVAGALLPRNAGWRQVPPQSAAVIIGVDATLAHAELILPVATPGHDWRTHLPAGTVPPAATYLAIGWGDAAFYRATPTWADIDPRLAFEALFASRGSELHVTPLTGPAGRPVRLTAAEHARLVAFLEAEIAPGAARPGYGASDHFLPARSRYSWRRTCNQWVADGLAAAGVRVGRWTPIAPSLMWRFEESEERRDG